MSILVCIDSINRGDQKSLLRYGAEKSAKRVIRAQSARRETMRSRYFHLSWSAHSALFVSFTGLSSENAWGERGEKFFSPSLDPFKVEIA